MSDTPQPLQRLAERSPLAALREFLALEAASGILLMLATVLALICANTALAPLYDGLLTLPVAVQFGDFSIYKPLLLWINDGLMAVFFFLVGMEVKRELLDGELSDPAQMVLPAAGAIGGVALPAAIYAWLNWGDAQALGGWAIPAATDIAFALGVLALLGSRVPTSLKTFLLVLAILDDLAAIVIIAIFYSSNLSLLSLVLALSALAGLIVMNVRGSRSLSGYLILGTFMWICVLKSGVHATLAGVALALTIPLQPHPETGRSMLRELEHDLHPAVAYAILPLFAFANAGIDLRGLSLPALLEPIPLGIFLGLFVGKQVGVFACAALVIGLGLARRPEGAGWLQLWGVCVLTGIGFTMSLFVSGLAFENSDQSYAGGMLADRLGILLGSLASAIFGALLLWWGGKRSEIRP